MGLLTWERGKRSRWKLAGHVRGLFSRQGRAAPPAGWAGLEALEPRVLLSASISVVSIEMVSVSAAGTPGDDDSGRYGLAISADGRFVAFASAATNLVPNDTNGFVDIFVHDRQTGAVELISVTSDGAQADSGSFHPSISADGRFVTFESGAPNLLPSAPFVAQHIFVHDRQTGVTQTVSTPPDGNLGTFGSNQWSSISGDGRFVAFESLASEAVTGGTFGSNIFVKDLQTGAVEYVSRASDGTPGNAGSNQPVISADGRFVLFYSFATNLVEGDTNEAADAFIHDRQTGVTERVSVASDGTEGDSHSGFRQAISADGRFVAFESFATNLVADDTNGAVDVFVHDRETGVTERVNVSSAGVQSTGAVSPSISADGRFVAFVSGDASLAPGELFVGGIFVRDRETGVTARALKSFDGSFLIGTVAAPSISGDGSLVAFESNMNNLAPGDIHFDSLDVFVSRLAVEDDGNGNGGGNGHGGGGALRFGDVAGQGNVRLQMADADGTQMRFSLRGGGSAQLLPGDGFFDLIVTGTTPRSRLVITTRSSGAAGDDGQLVIRHLTLVADAQAAAGVSAAGAGGTLNKLVARTTRLIGDLSVPGGLRHLVLGDIQQEATITIGASGDPRHTVNFSFLAVQQLELVSAMAIGNLTAVYWAAGGGSLTAPSLARLNLRGDHRAGVAGDFGAQLRLTDAQARQALGSARIAGDLRDGAWEIAGPVKTLTVQGDVEGADLQFNQPADPAAPRTLAVRRLTVAGAVRDSAVRMLGHAGAIVAGRLVDSALFVGADDTVDVSVLPAELAALSDPNATLGKLTLRGVRGSEEGALVNSRVVAGAAGVVNLGRVATDPQGAPSAIAAGSIRRLQTLLDSGRVRLSNVDDPAEGDTIDNLEIRLLA